MSGLDETIRIIVREEVRAAVRDALAELRGTLAPPVSDDGYLSVAKAAELAEVHPDTVRAWVKEGRLPRYSAGRELRLRRSDLHAFLTASGAATPTPAAEAAGILARRRAG